MDLVNTDDTVDGYLQVYSIIPLKGSNSSKSNIAIASCRLRKAKEQWHDNVIDPESLPKPRLARGNDFITCSHKCSSVPTVTYDFRRTPKPGDDNFRYPTRYVEEITNREIAKVKSLIFLISLISYFLIILS